MENCVGSDEGDYDNDGEDCHRVVTLASGGSCVANSRDLFFTTERAFSLSKSLRDEVLSHECSVWLFHDVEPV